MFSQVDIFPITDALKFTNEIIFLSSLYNICSTGLIRPSCCKAEKYAQNSQLLGCIVMFYSHLQSSCGDSFFYTSVCMICLAFCGLPTEYYKCIFSENIHYIQWKAWQCDHQGMSAKVLGSYFKTACFE